MGLTSIDTHYLILWESGAVRYDNTKQQLIFKALS